jgi:formate dehydrogenase subunit gamma
MNQFHEPWSADRAREIIETHRHLDGPAIPILHALQEAFGCVPRDAVPLVADALNLSRAEVHGIVSFYHDFREEPAGRHVLKLCRAEACQSMGADALAEKIQRKLGAKFGETTRDRNVTIEPVYCLGLCACAPSAMLDGKPIGRLTTDKIERFLGVDA